MKKTEFSLKEFNTFGIQAMTNSFMEFISVTNLQSILSNKNKNEPLLILGGGSNVLFTQDFKGLVLKNNIKGIKIVTETQNEVIIKGGSGEIWHDLVLFCVSNNWGGVENLSLIPGSVGAAPMQNIGAYGVEIKNVFEELEALNIESGKIEKFDKKACDFGYRESVFKRKLKNKYIITSVSFRLQKQAVLNTSYGAINTELNKLKITKPTVKNVSDAVIAIRQNKLPNPTKIGNAGSFFKNPVIEKLPFKKLIKKFPNIVNYPNGEQVKIAAGWLIEQAGWKGKTFDNYGVHKNQALVLVNYGGATGQQIYDLSEKIINSVQQKFGITLEREVNIY